MAKIRKRAKRENFKKLEGYVVTQQRSESVEVVAQDDPPQFPRIESHEFLVKKTCKNIYYNNSDDFT